MIKINQNFNFSSENSKENILNGIKVYTTRKETEYRMKCNKDDQMHLFTGLRTPNVEKFGDALVLETYSWNQNILDRISLIDENRICPFLKTYTWKYFAFHEGFKNFGDLLDYFTRDFYSNEKLRTFFFVLTKNGD